MQSIDSLPVTLGRDRMGTSTCKLSEARQRARQRKIKYGPECFIHLPIENGGGFVYVLRCPFSGVIKYIGSTYNPTQRFYSHAYGACKPTRKWIVSLRESSSVFRMDIVAATSHYSEAFKLENRLIEATHKAYPGQIFNKTEAEIRAALRSAKPGKPKNGNN